MEKVRPLCGQPSDRGRLMNRTEHNPKGDNVSNDNNNDDVTKNTKHCKTSTFTFCRFCRDAWIVGNATGTKMCRKL